MRIEEATLYNYFRSSASYRLRIALALKGLAPAHTREVNLVAGEQRSATYKAITPAALVPSVQFPEGSYSQSLALIEWLDATYPEPRLIPQDPARALASREIALSIACDIHPLNSIRILNYITGPLGASEAQKLEWYRHWIRTGFDTVEVLIGRHRGSGPYCLGADVTVADVCLVPQVANARRFSVDIADYPLIVEVDAQCRALPAFATTAPNAT